MHNRQPHHNSQPTTADRVGDAVFYLGFVAGLLLAGSVLYLEMKEMDKGVFDALAADSAIPISLIAAFLVPLAVGWMGRFLISGRRY